MEIIDTFIPVAIFLLFGLAIPLVIMFLVKQLSPRSKSPVKFTTYESGSVPTGSSKIMFNVEYYAYAILFVLFDVELLFLYPWVTVYVNDVVLNNVENFTTSFSVFAMALFMVVVLLGLLYEWKKGVLQWVK
ncbi:MAG: NADH-quinone oxidoreductase subunit A [ANME-2 cluster archaeon]|nr:NADH-quinone oxidoreductase subunit A [ANME-2 cluster archaeon]MDF1556720.1 NADH-quinone oxidoreductase subunit A [ANME-2 cluster archaeon]